ncbi:MAG TPA: Xaa-Pro peptidase family protein [Actinomycetota bacterium]|jgi:Xaa-Pro aminopeptidase
MEGSSRIGRIQAALESEGLDAAYIAHLPNVRYLCGFTGSWGCLVVGHSGARFLTDGRYRAQAAEEVQGAEVEVYGLPDQLDPALQRAFFDLSASGVPSATTVGFESAYLTVAALDRLRGMSSIELRPTTQLVERLRVVKEPAELDRIREAARMADEGLAHVLERVTEGVSERELALELEFFMRRQGADDVSFDPIVAAAERSALPHAHPSDRQVEKGRYLLFDLGCIHEGYCSDMTRTVMVGDPDERHREIYDLVARAQQAGLDAVRPGRPAAEVDRAARQVIEEAGLGDAFGHGLGHGVGLEIHEAPTLRSTSREVLEVGQVITIEPGVYLPGWGGVRIEDLVVVTSERAEVLSQSTKALQVL